MVNGINNISNRNSLASSTSSTISSLQTIQNQKQNEITYSYVLRCCLFPFKKECTDFFCNQKIGSKFRSYTYKKRMNMAVKTPKVGSNSNIDAITKVVYTSTLQEFYKSMEESSMFKDYLIFYIQLLDIQVKKYQPTYHLTDANCDTILMSCTHSFVKLFKDFAAKHLENFKEKNYEIFTSKVYLSLLSYYLREPSNIESLESSDDIQNWARKIFKIDSHTHRRILESVKDIINQKTSKLATLADFKKYLSLIERDKYEHSLPEDYYSRDLYEMWKKMEKSQIIKDITSLQNNIVINSSNQNILNSNTFYFIPPEPYEAFKQLVELCMYKDCDSTLEGEDILSENSKNLIAECEFRWRIPSAFKDIIILDILIQNYMNNFIGVNDVSDFIQKFINNIDKNDNIRIHEIEFLCSTFDNLIDKLMNDISHVFQIVNDIRDIQPFIFDIYSTIKLIHKSKLYQTYMLKNNIRSNLEKIICDNFKVALEVNYKNIELNSFNSSHNNEKVLQILNYFNTLRENVDNFQSVNTLRENNINLIKIISATYFNNAVRFLPNIRKDEKLEYQFSDLFEIFKFLKSIHEKANYSARTFVGVEDWFKAFVDIWLSASDETIKSRIENIIKFENYEPINIAQKIYHSDSVLDLFKHFDLVLSSMNQIEWSKVTDHAEFIKQFIRIINKLIFEYVKRMNLRFQALTYEPSYSDDLFKLIGLSTNEIRESPIFKEITNITKPELFIKINNIFKTYNLLEKICESSEIPYYHNILVSQTRSTSNNDIYTINDSSERFRISVIKIDNLLSNSAGSVSPFIEMNLGTNQLFRTNMKSKTLNPEFYEEFIIKISETTSSVLDIKVKNGGGKEVTVLANTKMMLRSILFEDGLIHNVELPLVPQGTLHLRISKLKTIDEIRYYVLNISEFLDYTLEDCCSLITKLISSIVVGYVSKMTDLNRNMEIQDTERQLIPVFEYLNNVLLNINTYLDLNINKYIAEKVDHPVFKKYTLEENRKNMEKNETIAIRQQTRMRLATQGKFKNTVTRVQTLMNIVKNQPKDFSNQKINHSYTVKNDFLNDDLFKDYEYENLPVHDVIRLIWDRIVQDFHEIILQNYDIYGNSTSEKGKLTTKFHNLWNTTMTSVALNMPKNMQKMNNMFESNIIFNQKSVGIINNSLELLKSFFACEIDKTCYGFPKEELETESYIELKNFIKLIKENDK
ncbi:hypothetical protein BCR32DRAFT_244519 [Anaeromyces robustus]|uniref:C2 domain-containing protein n=1 Tax=Anaeromyces robustus TaxID=1754192 RepID=A0A1Y1X8A6_9FUNG|nr:hypothetical protein BCR32DRAFT_244519 [Anaeromyces robustus]|eukprot:ORX81977.1 hypothetical protein BCR32DRAFT_244519 [Anaeromyces robustus]